MKVLFIKSPSSKEPTWANYQDSKKWTWPEINKDEIKIAIFISFIKKVAGPDIISFLIIKKIYQVLEDRFYKLYKSLIESGYHSNYWKEAIGVILKKLNRKATIPKSYRVISLLNYLEKVAEKIIATRLFFLTELIDLLDSDQIDDRRQKSVINAVLSLVHDI